MVHHFVKDLCEGKVIESAYLVREKSFDLTKNGSAYISLELADSTGTVNAKRWDANRGMFDSFEVDDFLYVKAGVESYKGYPQLKIEALKKLSESDVDISLYVPSVDKDVNGMFDSFISALSKLQNPFLKKLIDMIFSDEDTKEAFKRAPAASDFHHPYLGGLLEHTLNCIEMCDIIAARYTGVNSDLLLCGAALHDIGKIEELSYKRSFYYTDRGRLIGHIVLGVNMVEDAINRIKGFPGDLRDILIHVILSHHGEQEWGSPKRPMCLEAVILHHVDNLDAKINGFDFFVRTYNDPGSNWSKYSKMFREFLYKKEVPREETKKGEEKNEEKNLFG